MLLVKFTHRHSSTFLYWKSTCTKDTTWLLEWLLHILLIIVHSLVVHRILITTHHWGRGHGRLHLLLHWGYRYRRWRHTWLLMHLRHWHLGVGGWNRLWHPIFCSLLHCIILTLHYYSCLFLLRVIESSSILRMNEGNLLISSSSSTAAFPSRTVA